MNLIGVQNGTGSAVMQNVFGMVFLFNRLITSSVANASRIK